MINEPNKSIEETTLQKIGNLIKIPYYDLIEESHHQSPFIINGFQVLELDETNENLYQDVNIPDIETKRGLLLKKKADIIENHYKSYSEEELSKVHCSICYMNGFCKNELLYFRDKKHLISYLQYCFIFLKKNLFMNHTVYMNNRYDLYKIDQGYFVGFHFRIPKTICKSCFIQLINKEFLLSKLKNEISDYDESVNRGLTSPNKVTNLLKNKRKRKKKLLAIRTGDKEKEDIGDEKEKEKNDKIEQALKSIQITPIVISLSNNETPKKIFKRRNVKIIFGKKRRKKQNKIKNNKYNGNVDYDEINNTLIIQKNILENYEENKNIKNNIPINYKKINDTKIKQKENKKEEQSKIGDKYKLIKFNNMKINRPINMNIISDKKEKSAEKKNNTIIINKISNSKGIREKNMNKVGFIQINNNDNNKKISNNIQNILISIDQLISLNFSLNPQKISNDLNRFMIWLENLNQFCSFILQRMENNSIFTNINHIRSQMLFYFFITFEDIREKINENRILIEYSLLTIKKYMEIYQQMNKSNENRINYKELSNIQQSAYNIQEFYKFINKIILDGLQLLKDNIDEMIVIIIGKK